MSTKTGVLGDLVDEFLQLSPILDTWILIHRAAGGPSLLHSTGRDCWCEPLLIFRCDIVGRTQLNAALEKLDQLN